jgi:GNAT superfamily N-acetyltransferase
MDVRLRPLRREHLPALAALLVGTRPGLAPAEIQASLEDGRLAGDRLLVLEERGDVRGFAWLAPRGAFGRPLLRGLVVAPDARGRGDGRALLAAAIEEAARTGSDLFLLVPGDDDGARGFAVRHGFEPVGDLPAFPAPGGSSFLLRLRLGAP